MTLTLINKRYTTIITISDYELLYSTVFNHVHYGFHKTKSAAIDFYIQEVQTNNKQEAMRRLDFSVQHVMYTKMLNTILASICSLLIT